MESHAISNGRVGNGILSNGNIPNGHVHNIPPPTRGVPSELPTAHPNNTDTYRDPSQISSYCVADLQDDHNNDFPPMMEGRELPQVPEVAPNPAAVGETTPKVRPNMNNGNNNRSTTDLGDVSPPVGTSGHNNPSSSGDSGTACAHPIDGYTQLDALKDLTVTPPVAPPDTPADTPAVAPPPTVPSMSGFTVPWVDSTITPSPYVGAADLSPHFAHAAPPVQAPVHAPVQDMPSSDYMGGVVVGEHDNDIDACHNDSGNYSTSDESYSNSSDSSYTPEGLADLLLTTGINVSDPIGGGGGGSGGDGDVDQLLTQQNADGYVPRPENC